MKMQINIDKKKSRGERGYQLMYESFTDIRMNKINVEAGLRTCPKEKKKGQAMVEYFLILMVIVSLTIIGVTNLLPKEEGEPGRIERATRNYYNRKMNMITGGSN